MEWHDGPDHDFSERDKEYAEDLGLSGHDFIGRENDPAVCQALAELLSEQLHRQFVSSRAVQALHPEISFEMARYVATTLSIQLVQRSGRQSFDCPVKDLRADMKQILSGTSMGTHEGLSMLCLVLGEDVEGLLMRAHANKAFLETSSSEVEPEVGAMGYQANSQFEGPKPSPLLIQTESQETIFRIGKLLTRELHKQLVSPQQIETLHSDIPIDIARGYAYELSLSAVMSRLRRAPDPRVIDHSSLNQILGGTLSSRMVALEALCQGLNVDSSVALDAARTGSFEEGKPPR
jgi:hypothetical protein